MANPPLPPCHDLVRLIRPTLDETTAALLEHLQRRPNPWSYEKARALAPFAFGQEVPLPALKHACDTARLPQAGRSSTWEVVQLVRAAGAGRNLQCHAMGDGRVQVRSDLSIRVAADFYFVEAGRPSVFWLQPRRGFGLTDKQFAMFGALLKIALLRGDFAEAGVEILDLAAPDRRGRTSRTLTLPDLPYVDEDEVTEGVQRVVAAYDTIQRMGLDWVAIRRGNRPERPKARDADLFDT